MIRYILLLTIGLFSFTGKRQPVAAQSFPDKESLGRNIDSLMLRFRIPGLQLAIVKDEQIVYRQSYGWADVEQEIPVTDSTRFRIASLSKPITVIALLKLIDTNQLTAGRFVFGENGILSDDYEIPDNDWVKKITIQHLIDHKSGWTNEPNDPMFWNPDLTQKQIIQRILSSRLPVHEPGTQYYYSNFGYCILGRVIEKITGIPYEDYVIKEILLPCSITEMVIGGDTYEERYPNEAAYYSQESLGAYMMAVRRMDSHGGWIASAVDLVCFLMHIDRNPKVKDIISEQVMKNTYFANMSWDHNGSLPGTSSVIVRKDNSWGYAVLINTRTLPMRDIINEIRRIMDEHTPLK